MISQPPKFNCELYEDTDIITKQTVVKPVFQ